MNIKPNRHGISRFPHPNPLPEGEGSNERLRDFHGNERACAEPRLPNWANGFPYVNGGLFAGNNAVPHFTRMARSYLIHAGNLN